MLCLCSFCLSLRQLAPPCRCNVSISAVDITSRDKPSEPLRQRLANRATGGSLHSSPTQLPSSSERHSLVCIIRSLALPLEKKSSTRTPYHNSKIITTSSSSRRTIQHRAHIVQLNCFLLLVLRHSVVCAVLLCQASKTVTFTVLQ